jgi:hypothetical protein
VSHLAFLGPKLQTLTRGRSSPPVLTLAVYLVSLQTKKGPSLDANDSHCPIGLVLLSLQRNQGWQSRCRFHNRSEGSGVLFERPFDYSRVFFEQSGVRGPCGLTRAWRISIEIGDFSLLSHLAAFATFLGVAFAERKEEKRSRKRRIGWPLTR